MRFNSGLSYFIRQRLLAVSLPKSPPQFFLANIVRMHDTADETARAIIAAR